MATTGVPVLSFLNRNVSLSRGAMGLHFKKAISCWETRKLICSVGVLGYVQYQLVRAITGIAFRKGGENESEVNPRTTEECKR